MAPLPLAEAHTPEVPSKVKPDFSSARRSARLSSAKPLVLSQEMKPAGSSPEATKPTPPIVTNETMTGLPSLMPFTWVPEALPHEGTAVVGVADQGKAGRPRISGGGPHQRQSQAPEPTPEARVEPIMASRTTSFGRSALPTAVVTAGTTGRGSGLRRVRVLQPASEVLRYRFVGWNRYLSPWER